MGHAHSKKRRQKKKQKHVYNEIVNDTNDGGTSCLQHNPHARLHRLSGNIDRFSFCNPQSSEMRASIRCNTVPVSRESLDKMQDEEIYNARNINSHPVFARLQNEQNKRWESMEQRMNKIRTSAMQEAERRKYAQMFKARQNDDRTKMLLLKASEVLSSDLVKERIPPPLLLEEDEESDNGEIIPVQILTQEEKVEEPPRYLQILPSNFAGLDLSDPKMMLLLPFLFPIFLIAFLLRGVLQSLTESRAVLHLTHKKS